MLKRLLLLMALMPFLFACDNANKGKSTNQTKVYDVLTLLPEADTLVGKEVVLRGKVTHVCSHSGKRCFIEAKDSSGTTILVTAAGDFETFDREIIGKEIEVSGVLNEQRIEQDQIQAKEEAVAEKKASGTEQEKEHCDTEQKNVDKMRKWMQDNNKDYYANYYIEGKKYSVVK